MAPSFMPPCPDTITKSPARTNGLYGPSGFGVLIRRTLPATAAGWPAARHAAAATAANTASLPFTGGPSSGSIST